jgi:hypothetical protein
MEGTTPGLVVAARRRTQETVSALRELDDEALGASSARCWRAMTRRLVSASPRPRDRPVGARSSGPVTRPNPARTVSFVRRGRRRRGARRHQGGGVPDARCRDRDRAVPAHLGSRSHSRFGSRRRSRFGVWPGRGVLRPVIDEDGNRWVTETEILRCEQVREEGVGPAGISSAESS